MKLLLLLNFHPQGRDQQLEIRKIIVDQNDLNVHFIFREANSAINNLNGKSPLFWSVGFVNMLGENSLNHSSELIEAIIRKMERRIPLRFPPTAAVRKRATTPIYPGKVFRGF